VLAPDRICRHPQTAPKTGAAAEKFIDFLLSQPFQEDVPMQMFVFPVLPEAVIPEAFQKPSSRPSNLPAWRQS